MFGGYEKSVYLCIRNRETNGASLTGTMFEDDCSQRRDL